MHRFPLALWILALLDPASAAVMEFEPMDNMGEYEQTQVKLAQQARVRWVEVRRRRGSI